MFTVTDTARIENIIASKAPRPWRDVILEVYPEATIDRNGRAHAPYDGYECPLTGKNFAAGEYLPMSEPEDTYRVISGAEVNHPTAMDLNGVVHTWADLTRAQRMAVFAELIEQSKAYDALNSDFVGIVGAKVDVDVTVQVLKAYPGIYGTVFFHVLKDVTGNVMFYKGSIRLGGKGTVLKLTAKVKAHNTREGVKQTILERPKTRKEI
jgi:hypothetical protein